LYPAPLWLARNRRWRFRSNNSPLRRRTRLDFRRCWRSGGHAQRVKKTPNAFLIGFVGLAGLLTGSTPFGLIRGSVRLLRQPAKDQRNPAENEQDENVNHSILSS
jgi:hypothetical protein